MNKTFSFDVLSDGSLVLTLGAACLQTTAKRAHCELTMALLAERAEGTGMEALVDPLAGFLITTNFATLRTEHPELAGGTRCRVRLYRCTDGIMQWEMV